MTQLTRLIFSICFVLLLVTGALAVDDAPPAWLKQAASVTPPTYKKDVPAVAIYNEQQVSLGSDGKLTTVENYAVRILSREGRKYAVATAFYLVSSGKVKDMQAWIIRPGGSYKDYDKKTILDIISDPDDVYNEGRIKVIDASDDVDAGYVFGYTIESEEPPLFYQVDWNFQDRLPTLLSRYTLRLPSGWKATSMTFNHSEITPQVNGSIYTWEVRDLAPIPSEPMSPSIRNLAPRIAISYSPEESSQAVNRAFSNWLDVSRWATALYEPKVIVDDEIANKARELTAGAKTELEKIRAVGAFVQNLQYISIDIGVGYGNGYIPRASNLVLSRGYGDCKDKANLMRALLRALKIEAYPVVIFAGDPTFVRAEWASPDQFNHCIIAVKVSDETEAPTVITHEKLGRLLIFDATDPFTPVGDLPDHEQGSSALIIAGDNGGLATMPVTPVEFNAFKRDVEVNLTGDGSIEGVIRENAVGQSSSYIRGLFRSLSSSDVNKVFEGWLTRGATAASLKKLTPKDNHANASFDLDVEFSAPRYGQLMQGRLLIFKPAIVNRANSIYLTEKERILPVLVDADSFSEKAVFKLPEGFVVDEMPDAVDLETSFGKYSTSYEVKDGKLFFTRTLIMKRTTVPVEKYEKIRQFYTEIMAAEQAPVVLEKQ
ncbi:MAG: DUF3857 and transglutaminase domain-containing protein [Pyrinomonadaceae bacterium]